MLYKITFIIFLTTLSCKRINKPEKNKKKEIHSKKIKGGVKDVYFKYSDTIFKNAYGTGEIDYDITHQGIDSENILERYIILYTSIDQEAKTFEEIEKTKQNGFLDTTSNKSGKFYFEYKFDKVGSQTLKLAFEDMIVFLSDSIKNDTLIATKYPIAELPVYVIDSSAIIGYDDKGIVFIVEKDTFVKRKDSLRLAKKQEIRLDSIKKVLNNP